MIFNRKLVFKRYSDHFEFRVITEDDVTEKYVAGLQKQWVYIENIPDNVNLEKQMEYVKRIRLSENDCLFGLFVNQCFVATAGVQNVKGPGFATNGIFVFDKNCRGKGYGKILVWSGAYLVYKLIKCCQFSSGVKKINKPSLNAFLSCGYHISKEYKNSCILKLDHHDLICPPAIEDIEIV